MHSAIHSFFGDFDPKNSKLTPHRHINPPLKSEKRPFEIIKGGIRDFFFFLDAPYNRDEGFSSVAKQGFRRRLRARLPKFCGSELVSA